jgi:hypothetical protein
MSRQRCLAAAFLLVVGIVFPPTTATASDPATMADEPGVQLAHRWRAGETIPFIMVNQIRQNMAITMDAQDAPAMPETKMTIDQRLTGRQEVLEVAEDGTARVRLHYDTLQMDLSSPMMSMSWDSEEEPVEGDATAAELEQSLRPMLENPLTLEITRQGKLLSAEGLEAMAEAMAGAAGANAQALGGVDDASLEQMLQQAFFPLPAEPVAPGDTWSDRQEVPIPFVGGVLIGDIEYTLEGVADGLAQVDLAGTYAYQPSDEPNAFSQMMSSMGDVEMEMSIESGSFGGALTFDVDNGRYDLLRSTVVMAMTMKITPGPDAAEGMPKLRMALDMEVESEVDYGESGSPSRSDESAAE